MQLLLSDFAAQFEPQIHEFLESRDSIPAFLSVVTLRLVDATS